MSTETGGNVAVAVNDLFDQHGPMPIAADMGDCLFTAMEVDNTALAAPATCLSIMRRRAADCSYSPTVHQCGCLPARGSQRRRAGSSTTLRRRAATPRRRLP
ncbi:MAG: hypothetical protein HC834_09045 [Rhodospirillales bacterium]|nr:hypothetical protein [Rhodospirillales bacterium]